jgi:putative flippase GtrA
MRNFSPLKKQVIKFTLIGILAVIVDLICYYFLLRLLPERAFSVISNEAFAKTVSFLCGLNVTYIFNKSWTWKNNNQSSNRFVKFITLYSISLFVNVFMNSLFLRILHKNMAFSAIPYKYFVAFVGATLLSASFNFIGQKSWVFK